MENLIAERDRLRAAAEKDPRHAKLEELRSKIVALKIKGDMQSPELLKLTVERDKLQEELYGPVKLATANANAARRAQQQAAQKGELAKLEKLSTEELEARRSSLTEKRRELKREQRLVVQILSARDRETRMDALFQNMSPEDKAEFKKRLGA